MRWQHLSSGLYRGQHFTSRLAAVICPLNLRSTTFLLLFLHLCANQVKIMQLVAIFFFPRRQYLILSHRSANTQSHKRHLWAIAETEDNKAWLATTRWQESMYLKPMAALALTWGGRLLRGAPTARARVLLEHYRTTRCGDRTRVLRGSLNKMNRVIYKVVLTGGKCLVHHRHLWRSAGHRRCGR